ncbi:hypothetical protein [Hydrococcus rivularis]|nr:hypothetical protein [Hydrococcus rivularis]
MTSFYGISFGSAGDVFCQSQIGKRYAPRNQGHLWIYRSLRTLFLF